MSYVEYKEDDVLTAAEKRVAAVFDKFERVVVSVSGGKDSTVIRELAIREAERRGRRVEMFFLDQEAEYQSTIDIMSEWMRDPRVDPAWYQVPLLMTNATSHREYWLRAWWPGEEWLRPKDDVAIHAVSEDYPRRFYRFFEWYEEQSNPGTAFIIGLRSKESFNRYRAVTSRPGYEGWSWSTVTAGAGVFRVYPIYDWTFGDVWKYIADNGLRYNHHYDRMYALHGVNKRRMRVSNLIHEKSFKCLGDLQVFEPETYDKLLARLDGVHCAALYRDEDSVYKAHKLPPAFESWRAYRDYLLDTTDTDKAGRYRKRFSGQSSDEETCRQQCRQLLINDWENNVPVSHPNADRVRQRLRDRWWDEL